MSEKFSLSVNGSTHTVTADPDMPLFYALRDDLGLNNPHFGCGLAQCGASPYISTVSRSAPASRHCPRSAMARSQRSLALAPRTSHIRCRPPRSRSRCRNAATASMAGS